MTDTEILEEVTYETIEEQRVCTRCDGSQHLIVEFAGMGKYVCDTCMMSVGFDRQADPSEFLLHRGLPFEYTKKIFGTRLMKEEARQIESS